MTKTCSERYVLWFTNKLLSALLWTNYNRYFVYLSSHLGTGLLDISSRPHLQRYRAL